MSLTRRTFIACACCAAATLSATAAPSPSDGTPQRLELGTPVMTRLAPAVWVAQIAPDAWLHTTTGPPGSSPAAAIQSFGIGAKTSGARSADALERA